MTRISGGVISGPAITDVTKWFAEMDRPGGEPFLAKGRKQLKTPRLEIFK